jgi:hypothetical protein
MNYCDELNTIKTKLTTTNPLRTVAAIAATVAALEKATGNIYIYDYDTDAFYKTEELIQEKTNPMTTTEIGLPTQMVKLWTDLRSSGIANPKKYTYGTYEGIQPGNDPTEYICTDFTRDAVKHLQTLGHDVYSMGFRMKWEDGTISDHEIILAVDDTRQYIYAIDPSSKIDRTPKTTLTKTEIETILNELTNPKNWKPILKTTTKNNERLQNEIGKELGKIFPGRTAAPTTVTLKEMTMIEPQDMSIYGTGTDLTEITPDWRWNNFEGSKITDVDIIKSPGEEVYLGEGIKIESGDTNAVIPTNRQDWMMMQTTGNPKTLEELDKLGTIRTFNNLRKIKNEVK